MGKKLDTEGHVLEGFIHIKCPGQESPQTKADQGGQGLRGCGGGQGFPFCLMEVFWNGTVAVVAQNCDCATRH